MTAILVDDEKHCLEVMTHLLRKYCPDLRILAECSSGGDALQAIATESPDIVFLDIEMPGMSGFELLERVNKPNFEIVFTTAYNEYAIKAIKHSALDYLLKPVNKDELIVTVNRAREHKALKASQRIDALLGLLQDGKRTKRFAVPTAEGLILVDSGDVLYCESDSAYCKIFFQNSVKPLIISKTLKDVEEVLQGIEFCRIHHSYIINMKFVQKYIRGEGGEVVLINGQHLPVSRTRKQDFLNLLERI